MPGGTPEAYQHIEPIVRAVAAQVRMKVLQILPERMPPCLLGSTCLSESSEQLSPLQCIYRERQRWHACMEASFCNIGVILSIERHPVCVLFLS